MKREMDEGVISSLYYYEDVKPSNIFLSFSLKKTEFYISSSINIINRNFVSLLLVLEG